MSDPEYEIPLSPVYQDGSYVGVEIKNGNLYIVDRVGEMLIRFHQVFVK